MIGSIWGPTNVPSGTETVPPEQMYPYLYIWNLDHYDFTQDIDPGVGYWALTYSDCDLHVFPAPPLPPSSTATKSPLSRQIPQEFNDWDLIGVDIAEFDAPEPPTPPAP